MTTRIARKSPIVAVAGVLTFMTACAAHVDDEEDLDVVEQAIDTVPVPDSPRSTVAIGTWPTPEQPTLVDRKSTLAIDTVPVPDSPTSTVAIGTWPTPEQPVLGDPRVAIDTTPLPEAQ